MHFKSFKWIKVGTVGGRSRPNNVPSRCSSLWIYDFKNEMCLFLFKCHVVYSVRFGVDVRRKFKSGLLKWVINLPDIQDESENSQTKTHNFVGQRNKEMGSSKFDCSVLKLIFVVLTLPYSYRAYPKWGPSLLDANSSFIRSSCKNISKNVSFHFFEFSLFLSLNQYTCFTNNTIF